MSVRCWHSMPTVQGSHPSTWVVAPSLTRRHTVSAPIFDGEAPARPIERQLPLCTQQVSLPLAGPLFRNPQAGLECMHGGYGVRLMQQ